MWRLPSGNLGPVADARGHVKIVIRDLDQTVIGNPAHDLILSVPCLQPKTGDLRDLRCPKSASPEFSNQACCAAPA
jgi:hypothetical protein